MSLDSAARGWKETPSGKRLTGNDIRIVTLRDQACLGAAVTGDRFEVPSREPIFQKKKSGRPKPPALLRFRNLGLDADFGVDRRRALELTVEVGSRMADAEERAGGRVHHTDPTHVVQTRVRGGAGERGAAEREVDPAELEASRVPVGRGQEVDPLRLEEDVRARLRAGLLTGRAGRDADAAEQVLVAVVGEDADLVGGVIEAGARGALVATRVRPARWLPDWGLACSGPSPLVAVAERVANTSELAR